MAKFTVYRDKDELWRWRMVADNGRIMSDSGEGYDSEDNARRAIKRAIELMKTAQVEEASDTPV